jgi:hypothetical protein
MMKYPDSVEHIKIPGRIKVGLQFPSGTNFKEAFIVAAC